MIVETVKAIQMHLSRAFATGKELRCFLNTLSPDDFNDPEKVKVIDAFLFRFIKIQDLMGSKLFREVFIEGIKMAAGAFEDIGQSFAYLKQYLIEKHVLVQ